MLKQFKILQTDPRLVGTVFVLLATFGLSLKAIFIKLVYLAEPTIDAISILAIRFFLALPFFLLLLLYARKKSARVVDFRYAHLGVFLLLGIMGFYVSALLDFTALALIPAGLERLILFMYPTFVVVISLFVRPSEVTRKVFIALGVSYAGLVVVFLDQAAGLNAQTIHGAWLVLGAAMVFAIYTVASVKPIHEHGSIRFTAYAMFAASAATLTHVFFKHGLGFLDHGVAVYGYILPMAIFSTVLPLILMAEGVKRLGASSSSIIATSGPVLTITLAYLVLGETVTVLQTVGGTMIIAGVFLISGRSGARSGPA